MKKRCKKAGAMLVTLALCAGMIPSAFAANEPVMQWNFDSNQTDGWAGDAGWSANGSAPVIAVEGGMLKLTAEYAGGSLWEQKTVINTFDGYKDLSDVTEVTFDVHVPSSITKAGIVLYGTATYYQTTSNLEEGKGEGEVVDGYTKYEVVIPINGTDKADDKETTVADLMKSIINMRIYVVGGSSAKGEIVSYVDNISLNKEVADEPEARKVEAKSINDGAKYEDGSMGWTAEISGTPGDAVTINNPSWIITNSAEETATIENAAAGDTKISTEGTVVFGLVLTKTAIGENNISKVEFSY